MDYYFKFTAQEVILIMESLNEGQHKKVRNLIDKIHVSVEEQERAHQEKLIAENDDLKKDKK